MAAKKKKMEEASLSLPLTTSDPPPLPPAVVNPPPQQEPTEGTTRKKTRKTETSAAPDDTVLSLSWSLAELPSSQHRAGLAGLVLMARWIERLPGRKGVFTLKKLDSSGLELAIDQAGLGQALDELYAASQEEIEVDNLYKKKDGSVSPPLRSVEREIVDKNGKTKLKTKHVYPVVVPRGELLFSDEETATRGKGPWIKLWRDFVWGILRGVPAQREPFEARAEKRPAKDVQDLWEMLRAPQKAVPLPSTYYLGVQATTAEGVSFFDRARYQFLLHFWPLTVGIYVPQVIDLKEGKRDLVGFAVVIPDVSELDVFCDEYARIVRSRNPRVEGYRPAGAVIDLALVGALDMAHQLHARLRDLQGDQGTHDLVLGFDVIHTSKEGNNVRILSTGRIEPTQRMMNDYVRLKDAYGDPIFRQQRLKNLVQESPWFTGFDRLFATLPYKTQGIGSGRFCKDAREAFTTNNEGNEMSENKDSEPSMEQIVYQMARRFVNTRVEKKTGKRWEQVEGKEGEVKSYREAKEKIANDTFLAIRSRTGQDFLDYFAGTIGSVPHRLGEERFIAFTRWLRSNPHDARTLTLLALSAVS
jgi:CRISPR-associated protein Cmx8